MRANYAAPQAFQVYWRYCQTGEGAANVPFQPGPDTKLFVRRCYAPLLDKVLGLFHATQMKKRRRRVVVTGTPGIGKTCFLYHVMERFRFDDRLHGKFKCIWFVRLTEGVSEHFLFELDKPVMDITHNKSLRKQLVFERTVLHLVDGDVPAFTKYCAVLVAISPEPNLPKYSLWKKNFGPIAFPYMPLWTDAAELQEFQQLLQRAGVICDISDDVSHPFSMFEKVPLVTLTNLRFLCCSTGIQRFFGNTTSSETRGLVRLHGSLPY